MVSHRPVEVASVATPNSVSNPWNCPVSPFPPTAVEPGSCSSRWALPGRFPGRFPGASRRGRQREMQNAKCARGRGRGAGDKGTRGQGDKVTHPPLETGIASLLLSHRHWFFQSFFSRIPTPSLALNASLSSRETEGLAYQFKKLPQVCFGGFTLFSSRFHFCSFWALTLTFVRSPCF